MKRWLLIGGGIVGALVIVIVGVVVFLWSSLDTLIKEAVEDGVYHVAVFDNDDDICRDDGDPLREIVEKTKELHPHLRFHAVCGLHPDRVTPDLAEMFAERTFA